ncbi:MAG: hypothetical protein O2924_04640 [Chloroflexi bacterium]|nr:hypothetical protein [Chloroflexota bacterium]
MNEDPLFPYRTTPGRIALDLIDALSACPAVSRIAIYGSLVGDNHDAWSDVDAFCAVEGADGAWQAAAALRRAIPLRWHGLFNGVAAPSGRHWLLGESVFHPIDLSFDTSEEFDRKLSEGIRGFEIDAVIHLDRPGVASGGRPDVAVVTEEYDFTHALYVLTKAMKTYLRDAGPWEDLATAFAALEAAHRALTHRPPGTDPDDVMSEARTLYYTLFMERSRYGGDQ